MLAVIGDISGALSAAASFIGSQLAGQLLSEFVMAIAAALGITTAVKRGLGKLHDNKDTYWFFGSAFVVSLVLILSLQSLPSLKPDLHAQVLQTTEVGTFPNLNITTPVVQFAVQVENTGTMQTIAKNWKLTTTVDGHSYQGIGMQVPDILPIMDSKGFLLTYYRSSLVEQALHPIISGGQVTGLLLFNFPNFHKDFFKNRSPTFEISFEDVNSREYSTSVTLQEGQQTTENSAYIPGLNQTIQPPNGQKQQPQEPTDNAPTGSTPPSGK
jgi:hypothetical protein